MIYINKTVFIATLVVIFLAGLYGGYRIEKHKLDTIVAQKDAMYTQQVNDLKGQNMTLNKEVLMAKDHLAMVNGKMMVVGADGTTTPMKVDAALANNEKVTVAGTVVKKDGTQMKLTDGMSIWMDGTVMNSDGSVMAQ